MMFKIITFFIITLFVGLYVRVGILFILVCSDIIFLLAIVLSVLCFTVSNYPLGIFIYFFAQIK